MTMTRSMAAVCALAFITASAGCASIRAKRERTQRLERQLGDVRYQKPLDEVWQDVRQLLADRKYPLAIDDAEKVGQPEMNLAERLFSPAKGTRSLEDDVGLLQQLGMVRTGGKKIVGYYLETGWGPQATPRIRVRAEGADDGEGVKVRLFDITEDVTDHNDVTTRNTQLELELARRVDPAVADRIEAAVNAPAGKK